VVDLDARWLDALNRISGRAAHELKGALNGVSVNVEVVRSRCEKPDVAASALRTFATAASGQLDAVIEMTDALLGLARTSGAPTDVAQAVRRIVALLGPAARAEGKEVEVDSALDLLGTTTASGTAVRLAVGEALLAALDRATRVRCVAHGKGDARPLRIESAEGEAFAIDDAITTLVGGEGIHIEAESSAMVISFPR
jgi:signal transduction histidine kinase